MSDHELEWDQPALRLCARIIDCPEPMVPSTMRQCDVCGFSVWYDPKASLTNPAKEIIICSNDGCLEYVIEATK